MSDHPSTTASDGCSIDTARAQSLGPDAVEREIARLRAELEQYRKWLADDYLRIQADERARMRAAGFVLWQGWVHKDDGEQLLAYVAWLRKRREPFYIPTS